MIYLTQLADVARRTGFPVVETNDWKNRHNRHGGFDVLLGITVHHTASTATPLQDVAFICNGSVNAPISNFFVARDGTIYVCAAGSCNHGGLGGPYTTPVGTIPQDKVNFQAVSIEIANSGVGEIYPNVQIRSIAKLCAELCKDFGWTDANCVFAHKEWAPGRKIDPFGPWENFRDWGAPQGHIDSFRKLVAQLLVPAYKYPPPPNWSPDMGRKFVRSGPKANPDSEWNSFVVFEGGKYWVRTGEAIGILKAELGDPVPVDPDHMYAYGPVIGECPETADAWGVWKE